MTDPGGSPVRALRPHFGRVSARPSEYLIQLRRGRLRRHGAGLSVFVWPGDSVAILPTSIQRVAFVADQVTAEKVGVAVTGVAVYRIADPILAYRLLDCASVEATVAQLTAILRDMFVGAARRLVAALTVEQCLTRRKEEIAVELMREIQPVVSGRGRPDDATDRGWGLVVDTIEIQDVRVLSEQVFAALQAPFRAALEQRARQAAVERDQMVRLRELEAQQRGAAAQAALDLAAQEHARQLGEAEHELQRRRQEQRAALAREEARAAAALAAEQAAGQAERDEAARAARLTGEAQEAAAAAETLRLRLAGEEAQGVLRAELRRREREVENLLPEARLRYEVITRTLPALAEAFARSLGPVHLTQIGGDAGVGFFASAVAQVMAVARSAGVDLGALLGGRSPEGDGGA